MDATAKGIWLLPTHGRASTNLPRFLKAAIETGVSTPGAILVSHADYKEHKAAYEALTLPKGWMVQIVAGETCAGKVATWRYCLAGEMAVHAELEWVGWLADDLVPETTGWDVRLIAQLNGMNVVTSNDGFNAPKRANGAMVYSGDVVRAIGGLYPSGCDHYFLDDLIESLGKEIPGFWTCDMDVMVRHRHHSKTGERDATTSKAEALFDADERAWRIWEHTQRVPTIERILALMESRGVKMIRPDLKGIRLLIATPCGSGKYDSGFRRSLDDTIRALVQFGASVHFVEMVGCSDLVIARNRLFSTFLRGDHTHLFLVDDDMVWRPEAVWQLILAKKDFVAVAGPRKVFPPSFAVNCSDENNQPIPLRIDPLTGFFEVTAVGLAFVVLTRECVVRMSQHYADLTYVDADGREEVGFCLPIITNRRYHGEDFAYCYRWRAMGGRIFVASEIALGHVGQYVWEGAWGVQLRAKMAEEALVA